MDTDMIVMCLQNYPERKFQIFQRMIPIAERQIVLSLKNGLVEQHEQFFVTDDEMVDFLEDDKISLYFKSMQMLEPLHEILAQLSLKLEKFETDESERSFKKCSSSMSISFK